MESWIQRASGLALDLLRARLVTCFGRILILDMLFLVLIRPKISGKLKIILLCTQTHSLTHRRTVPGRKKGFDILLAEHKGRAKEKDAGPKRDAASSQSAHPTQPLGAPSSTPSGCHNGKTTPTLKLRLASTHLQRYKQNAVKDALAVKL